MVYPFSFIMTEHTLYEIDDFILNHELGDDYIESGYFLRDAQTALLDAPEGSFGFTYQDCENYVYGY